MDNTSFPRQLAETRKSRGYTQKQVAEALGISDRTYSKWETGENEMDVASLCRLADFYGISPAAFFPAPDGQPADVRARLASQSLGDAAKSWFRLHYDAMQGMHEASMNHFRAHMEDRWQVPAALTPPEDPAEAPKVRGRSLTTFRLPNLLALLAAGPELNLSLLLEPSETGWAWLKSEEESIQDTLRFLGMPGAAACLRVLYTRKPDSFLSAGYVAREAGITEAEASAFLEEMAERKLLLTQTMLRRGAEVKLYWPSLRIELAGILALVKSLLGGLFDGHVLGGVPNCWLDMDGVKGGEEHDAG